MTETTASPVASAEQIRWQRDAAAVLGKLLELAASRGLPAIRWTIASAGARLAGHCERYPQDTRQADYAAWRDVLGEPDTEHETTTSGGTVRLVATWDRQGPAGKSLRPLLSDRDGFQRASVVLLAEILPDPDDEDPTSAQEAWDETAQACVCTAGRCSRNDFRDHQGDSPGCMVCADLDPDLPCYAIARDNEQAGG